MGEYGGVYMPASVFKEVISPLLEEKPIGSSSTRKETLRITRHSPNDPLTGYFVTTPGAQDFTLVGPVTTPPFDKGSGDLMILPNRSRSELVQELVPPDDAFAVETDGQLEDRTNEPSDYAWVNRSDFMPSLGHPYYETMKRHQQLDESLMKNEHWNRWRKENGIADPSDTAGLSDHDLMLRHNSLLASKRFKEDEEG
jgi:hypothetical protein